jgi:hypothetical protein
MMASRLVVVGGTRRLSAELLLRRSPARSHEAMC